MDQDNNTPDTGWIAISGEFDAENDVILYRGKRVPAPEQQGGAPPQGDRAGIGLILSSQAITDGQISAEVEFAKVTPDSICEIAIAYDSNATHIVTAGLGSEPWAMFGIREFGGPKTSSPAWWDHRVSGERNNIKAGRLYRMGVVLRGASLTLQIDGVEVGTAEVSSPMGRPRQIGVFCKADHEITVRKFRADVTKPKAFVVMQFGGEYDEVYSDVVKEVCKTYEVNVLRADEVSGPGLIIGDIVRELAASQLVIADITPANANVYFEVGYALALAKPTILLAQKGTVLPFDVAGFRTLFYEDSIGGKKRLEDGLRRHLDAILAT
jgi:hypothetical protein